MKVANLKPALYAFRLADIQRIAGNLGYAIAVHGSMQRDFDVIAVPWINDCASPEDLVGDLCAGLPVQMLDGDPVRKPHGRLSFTLLMHGELFVDLAVIQPLPEQDSRGG